MKLGLVPEPIWRGSLEQIATERAATVYGPSGLTMLALVHSSGMGIPPRVVFDFAAWLKQIESSGRRWNDRLGRILEGLPLDEMGVRFVAIEGALRAEPLDAVRLLLLPLADLVRRKMQWNVLITRSPFARFTEAEYENYATAFEDTLTKLLEERSGEALASRRAIALVLAQYAKAGTKRDSADPLPDIRAIGYFLDATEKLAERVSQQANRSVNFGGDQRQSSKYQIDGVEGIRHAGPSEDPSSMLASQMLMPDAFRIERWMNEGFLALDRPPPLPRATRLSFAAIVLDCPDDEILSLVRAAWWLACRTLEGLLHAHDGPIDLFWMSIFDEHALADAHCRQTRAADRCELHLPSIVFPCLFAEVGAPFLLGRLDYARPDTRTGPAAKPFPTKQISESGFSFANPEELPWKALFLRIACEDDHTTISNWQDELAALGLADTAVVTLDIIHADSSESERSSIELCLGGGEVFSVPEQFAERSELVANLAQALLAMMREVVARG